MMYFIFVFLLFTCTGVKRNVTGALLRFGVPRERERAQEASQPHDGAAPQRRLVGSQFGGKIGQGVVDREVAVERHDGEENDRRVVAHHPEKKKTY